MLARTAACLAIAAVLPCAPAAAQFLTIPPPDWASAKHFGEAAYDPPVSPVPNWYLVRGGSWEVSMDIVQEMRVRIDARIVTNEHFGDRARIARYAIQFRGETKEGQRIVRLAGACRTYGTPPWRLSAEFLQVDDGGKCYFDAEYDPQEKRLRHFSYHGYA